MAARMYRRTDGYADSGMIAGPKRLRKILGLERGEPMRAPIETCQGVWDLDGGGLWRFWLLPDVADDMEAE